jgi:hypothetical protein
MIYTADNLKKQGSAPSGYDSFYVKNSKLNFDSSQSYNNLGMSLDKYLSQVN